MIVCGLCQGGNVSRETCLRGGSASAWVSNSPVHVYGLIFAQREELRQQEASQTQFFAVRRRLFAWRLPDLDCLPVG
jgi:hypothetical protein